jgi:hypothetical protein
MSSKDYPQSEYDDIGRADIAEGKYSERVDDGSKNEGKFGGSDKKGGDVEDSEEADTKLIERVQKYFFGNEELAHTFESFIKRKAHVVDLESEEYKLQYTQIFLEYKDLFEEIMEAFLGNELKISSKDFYMALKRKMDKDYDSNESIFAQILIAVTDFDVFMQMMRDAKRDMPAEDNHSSKK